jgi:cold shock CspA family protein
VRTRNCIAQSNSGQKEGESTTRHRRVELKVKDVKMQVVEIKTGRLQHFSPLRFGFIKIAEDGVYVDKFFHISSVLSGEPIVGCEVEFSDGFARGRTCATNVRFKPVAPKVEVSSAAEGLLKRKILEETLAGGNR